MTQDADSVVATLVGQVKENVATLNRCYDEAEASGEEAWALVFVLGKALLDARATIKDCGLYEGELRQEERLLAVLDAAIAHIDGSQEGS